MNHIEIAFLSPIASGKTFLMRNLIEDCYFEALGFDVIVDWENHKIILKKQKLKKVVVE